VLLLAVTGTVALGSTQALTDVRTTNVPEGGGEGDRCRSMTTLPSRCADCLEIWEPRTPGTLRAYNRPVQG